LGSARTALLNSITNTKRIRAKLMPSINDVYGSGKFIKSDMDGRLDIDGKPYEKTCTIDKIRIHQYPPEKGESEGKRQITVVFRELPDMEFGCNVTNARAIAKLAGTEDYTRWVGTPIELFVVPEEKSKTGHAIRVRKPRYPSANGMAHHAAPPLWDISDGKSVVAAQTPEQVRKIINDSGMDPSAFKVKPAGAARELAKRADQYGFGFAPVVGSGSTEGDIPF